MYAIAGHILKTQSQLIRRRYRCLRLSANYPIPPKAIRTSSSCLTRSPSLVCRFLLRIPEGWLLVRFLVLAFVRIFFRSSLPPPTRCKSWSELQRLRRYPRRLALARPSHWFLSFGRCILRRGCGASRPSGVKHGWSRVGGTCRWITGKIHSNR